MFLAVNCNCSTVVFMKVSRSEPISLTCLQPEQSLTTLFYRRVAPWLPRYTSRPPGSVDVTKYVTSGSILEI